MARQEDGGQDAVPSSWMPQGQGEAFGPESAQLNPEDEEAMAREAEEWNRQIQTLDERRNSYERLLRGIVQQKDQAGSRRGR